MHMVTIIAITYYYIYIATAPATLYAAKQLATNTVIIMNFIPI